MCIMCVLLTMPDIGKDCQAILKLKELFLLRSLHMVQVLYLIILLSLFQALVFDDYSNFFSDTRVFTVSCIKYV